MLAHIQWFAVASTTAKEITHEDVEMVRQFGAEFRRADESYVSALSRMAPVFELPLSDVTVVDGEKAVLECRVTATPVAEVTWYVDNVEIRQTDDYHIVFTADGWCRLIIRDDMLKDEAEYTVRAVNEAGTCIGTAYLTVLPATARERTAKELIEQESLMTLETRRQSPRLSQEPW